MKELPYFKFNIAEWLQGDITLCDFETQGLFINICAYYWSKQGNLTLSKVKLKFSHAKATLFENLSHAKIIKINDKKDTININFLDEQIVERNKNHNLLSDAGKRGVEAKRIIKEALNTEATLKPPLSVALPTLKHIEEDKKEDKDKEIKNLNPEFNPEQLKKVISYFRDKILKGFGLSEINNYTMYVLLTDVMELANNKYNNLIYFITNLHAQNAMYSDDDSMFRGKLTTYTGTRENAFEDGNYMKVNYIHMLKSKNPEYKKKNDNLIEIIKKIANE